MSSFLHRQLFPISVVMSTVPPIRYLSSKKGESRDLGRWSDDTNICKLGSTTIKMIRKCQYPWLQRGCGRATNPFLRYKSSYGYRKGVVVFRVQTSICDTLKLYINLASEHLIMIFLPSQSDSSVLRTKEPQGKWNRVSNILCRNWHPSLGAPPPWCNRVSVEVSICKQLAHAFIQYLLCSQKRCDWHGNNMPGSFFFFEPELTVFYIGLMTYHMAITKRQIQNLYGSSYLALGAAETNTTASTPNRWTSLSNQLTH